MLVCLSVYTAMRKTPLKFNVLLTIRHNNNKITNAIPRIKTSQVIFKIVR